MSTDKFDTDDPTNVPERLRSAMYEINDCWEYAETDAGEAHIDDAIHHLKSAIKAESGEGES